MSTIEHTSFDSSAGILLEAGTNELEILVIRVADTLYGVNVAKVREVLECTRPTKLPNSHEACEGTVRIREDVVQLIHLGRALDLDEKSCENKPSDRMLVMEFNEERIAFRVSDVDKILRVSWNEVQPMPRIGSEMAPVTSIVMNGDEIIQMLDFETVGASIGMASHILSGGSLSDSNSQERCTQPIVFAEDSMMVRTMIDDKLREAGFSDVRSFVDGEEAWKYLQGVADRSGDEPLEKHVAAVISDIEMPRMDGMHLTKKIREHAKLKDVPVILFSSIVSADNDKKGRQVGANAQVTKPRYDELVATLRPLLPGQNA